MGNGSTTYDVAQVSSISTPLFVTAPSMNTVYRSSNIDQDVYQIASPKPMENQINSSVVHVKIENGVSSREGQQQQQKKTQQPGIFGAVSQTAAALSSRVKFWRKEINPDESLPSPRTSSKRNGALSAVEPSGGIVGTVSRIVRRRVLNFLDRPPRWSKTVTSENRRSNGASNTDIFVTNRDMIRGAPPSSLPSSSTKRNLWSRVKRFIPFVNRSEKNKKKIRSENLKIFSNSRGNNNYGAYNRLSGGTRRVVEEPPLRGLSWVRSKVARAVTSVFNFDAVLYYSQYFSAGDALNRNPDAKDEFTAAQSPSRIVPLSSRQQEEDGFGNMDNLSRFTTAVAHAKDKFVQWQQRNDVPNKEPTQSTDAGVRPGLEIEKLQVQSQQSQILLGESLQNLVQASSEVAGDVGSGLSGVVSKLVGRKVVWPWEQFTLPLIEDVFINEDVLLLPTESLPEVEEVVPDEVSSYDTEMASNNVGVMDDNVESREQIQQTAPLWLSTALPVTTFVVDQVVQRLFHRRQSIPSSSIAIDAVPSMKGDEGTSRQNFAQRVFFSLPIVSMFASSEDVYPVDVIERNRQYNQGLEELERAREDVVTAGTETVPVDGSTRYRTAGISRDIDVLKHNPTMQSKKQPVLATNNSNNQSNSNSAVKVTQNPSSGPSYMDFFRPSIQETTGLQLPSLPTIDFRPTSMIPESVLFFGREETSNGRWEDKADVGVPFAALSAAEGSTNNQQQQLQVQNARDVAVKFDRAQEMRFKPAAVEIPLPSKADFALLAYRKVSIAIEAARAVKTERDALEFLKDIGLEPLIACLLDKVPFNEKLDKVDAVKGLCRLTRVYKPLADEVGQRSEVINVLCDMMEAPLKSFRSTFRSQPDKDRDLRAQHEAIALIHRLVRGSDVAVEYMRQDNRLRKILYTIMQTPDSVSASILNNMLRPTKTLNGTTVLVEPIQRSFEETMSQKVQVVRKRNSTTIVEYVNLRPSQMARVASWGLGGVPWKPRQPGQKGLRILSFDGGGTRGVLTIACLKEIFSRVKRPDMSPSDSFDIICGTSTGGIIAMLLGAQRRSVEESETLYDDFIGKIFATKSNLKLVTEAAAYDENELEKILYKMCGDSLVLDSNQFDCPRVFCVSTKVNMYPAAPKLWRNYNYPPNQQSRYQGTFRVNTMTAVRATTAAPTFFTPVQWEGGLFADGALVANNPTAIALQEAKALYPGVPIELVVSIGTGLFTNQKSNMQTMGWDTLVNQLVASSTDTEDVHSLLTDFLPKEKYFRFNPLFPKEVPIDVKDKAILASLKVLARDHFLEVERGPDAKYLDILTKTLRGNLK